MIFGHVNRMAPKQSLIEFNDAGAIFAIEGLNVEQFVSRGILCASASSTRLKHLTWSAKNPSTPTDNRPSTKSHGVECSLYLKFP